LPAFLFWLPIPLPMYLLGTIVVLVQTLVFCLLSTVYIAMAIEHAEH
jgi:F-type H+-transporting ATPase subunit a